jgi:chromosomal replication initiator protein
MNTAVLWQIVLADLESKINKITFQTLISQTKLLELNGEVAVIGCRQPMLIDLVEKRYQDLIKKTLSFYTKNENRLIFKTLPPESKKSYDEPLFKIPKTLSPLPSPSFLNNEYTFENFAVSSSNQMAYAAATAVANSPGKSYSPLFLYGGVGVGKTHLMQAIGHGILRKEKGVKLMYKTGEEFTNEIIEAIGNKTTVSFKKKYRHVNVLLVDDIQFIAGKNAVQEEFFHTFNAIQQQKGQVVLISDKPPEEIPKLEERLRSRFEGGLIIDIGPPDFELRTAILLIKAKQREVNLPIDIAKLIAANVENPRKLEGVLIRVLTESNTRKLPIDGDLVKNILGKVVKEAPSKNNLRPEEIINKVASFYNIKLKDLKGNRRDRNLARPRQILYYLLRTELNLPFLNIGEVLGGRDHTTIMHGVDKITELLSQNTKIQEDILGIKNKFLGK